MSEAKRLRLIIIGIAVATIGAFAFAQQLSSRNNDVIKLENNLVEGLENRLIDPVAIGERGDLVVEVGVMRGMEVLCIGSETGGRSCRERFVGPNARDLWSSERTGTSATAVTAPLVRPPIAIVADGPVHGQLIATDPESRAQVWFFPGIDTGTRDVDIILHSEANPDTEQVFAA